MTLVKLTKLYISIYLTDKFDKWSKVLLSTLIVACAPAHAEENDMAMGKNYPTRLEGREVPGPLRGGWSASGILQMNNPNRAVPLQAQFPNIENYTVQFNVVPPTTAASVSASSQAEVVWSIEGNPVRRLISVVDGTAITGMAEAVSVRLFDASAVLGTLTYQASITVARGRRGTSKQPPYLFPTPAASAIVAPGALSPLIPIPDDSGVISIFTNVTNPDVAVAGIPLEQTFVAQVNGAGGTIMAYEPRNFDWVPLAPGAKFLVFGNRATSPVNATFWATFGIDG